MKMKRLNFVCLSVIGMALAIGIGDLSAANKVLSNAELASFWGGTATSCDGGICCKCGIKQCTDIDCEYVPVDIGTGSSVMRYCKGLTPSTDVHDCWRTTNIDDNECERLNPTLTTCLADCDLTYAKCKTPTILNAIRYRSDCDDEEE